MATFFRLYRFHRRTGCARKRAIARAAATAWRDYLFTIRSPLQ